MWPLPNSPTTSFVLCCPTWLCTTHPGSGWHKVLWAEALNRPHGLRPTLDTSCDPPLCPDRLRLVVQASADVLHLPGKVLTVPLCLHCPRCCVLQQRLHNLIPLTAAHAEFPPLMQAFEDMDLMPVISASLRPCLSHGEPLIDVYRNPNSFKSDIQMNTFFSFNLISLVYKSSQNMKGKMPSTVTAEILAQSSTLINCKWLTGHKPEGQGGPVRF